MTKPERLDTRSKVQKQEKKCDDPVNMLDFALDIIYQINPQGLFTYLNNAVEELGYTPDELIGEHFSKIVHPEDLDAISRQQVLPGLQGKVTGPAHAPGLFDERRTRSRATKNLVFRLVPKNWDKVKENKEPSFFYGELIASGHYQPAASANNKMFLGTVGIIRNITERIILQEQKAKFTEQLYQSQKMDAIGQLAGGIAHDFNNLLGSISGYAELILNKFCDNNKKLGNYSQSILWAATRAADLTSKLLTFARKGSYKIVTTNIHSIIEDTIELATNSLNEDIIINKKLDAKNPIICCETTQIENAMINILLNANDAMPQGGNLHICTKNVFLDKKFIKSMNKKVISGDYLELIIRDNGVGMDEKVKTRIFEPFFTTKEYGKGVGLGLACVYGIIEGHRGIVTCESKPEKGTSFHIWIPVVNC